MLRTRLIVGASLIAALAALGWLDHRAALPGAWLMPGLVVFTLLATRELLALFAAKGLAPVAAVVYAGNLLIVLSPWAAREVVGVELAGASARASGAAELTLGALAVAVALVLLAEMARYQGPGRIVENLGTAAFALVYLGLMLSFAVRLRLEWGIGALASLVVVVKMGDTGAYFCGKAFGRHRMSPRLSPSKTLEGAVGAVVFSALASWAVFQWLVPVATNPGQVAKGSGSALPSLGYGVLLGLVGMVGDLAESLLKRDAACKDSSSWIPGLGGVLDMLDSILLAAPVAFACWRFGWIG